MFKPIRILIAEDQPILRLGLSLVLKQEGFNVVGEAADGSDCVRKVAELQPEVVLMDISMPVLNGVEASKRIRLIDKNVKIIMLTSLDNEEHIYAALAAGVNGYCLKETSTAHLVSGVKLVYAGDFWLDSNIALKVSKFFAHTRIDPSPEMPANSTIKQDNSLTALESHVLNLLIQGLSVAEIARDLNDTESSVRATQRVLLSKMACSKRVLAAARTLASTDRVTSTPCIFAEKFEIVCELGRGGMSVVYKARHTLLNRHVALKVLHADLITDVQSAQRFRTEGQLLSSLRHPNIVTVFDFGISDAGEPYLVMDYIQGRTLLDEIKANGALSPLRAIALFRQICSALTCSHASGILHRDVKPGNIMLSEECGNERPCIIDFGIAKLSAQHADTKGTLAGVVLGTPAYISPEQAQGQTFDVRSDIYSLGCTLYEALAGVPPFYAFSAWETIMQHVEKPVLPFSERVPNLVIPKGLENIVLRMLEKDPNDRYQTSQSVAEALDEEMDRMTIKTTTQELIGP